MGVVHVILPSSPDSLPEGRKEAPAQSPGPWSEPPPQPEHPEESLVLAGSRRGVSAPAHGSRTGPTGRPPCLVRTPTPRSPSRSASSLLPWSLCSESCFCSRPRGCGQRCPPFPAAMEPRPPCHPLLCPAATPGLPVSPDPPSSGLFLPLGFCNPDCLSSDAHETLGTESDRRRRSATTAPAVRSARRPARNLPSVVSATHSLSEYSSNASHVPST